MKQTDAVRILYNHEKDASCDVDYAISVLVTSPLNISEMLTGREVCADSSLTQRCGVSDSACGKCGKSQNFVSMVTKVPVKYFILHKSCTLHLKFDR